MTTKEQAWEMLKASDKIKYVDIPVFSLILYDDGDGNVVKTTEKMDVHIVEDFSEISDIIASNDHVFVINDVSKVFYEDVSVVENNEDVSLSFSIKSIRYFAITTEKKQELYELIMKNKSSYERCMSGQKKNTNEESRS